MISPHANFLSSFNISNDFNKIIHVQQPLMDTWLSRLEAPVLQSTEITHHPWRVCGIMDVR